MKATELMIGDLVEVKNYGAKEVIGIKDFDGVIEISENEDSEVEIPYDDISPIPLTAKILEKNGWFYNDLPMYQDWEKEGIFIQEDDGIHRSICLGINNSISVQYVHQLLQVLRLCGLNELADNFQID